MSPLKCFYIGDMIHTPFDNKTFQKQATIEIVNKPELADLLVTRERYLFTDELLALKKANVVWTHEPFLEQSNELVIKQRGAYFFIFNMFNSNIYVDNFFYAPNSRIPYMTARDLNVDFSDKKIGVLSTRRNTIRLVGEADYSLDNIRSDLALELHGLGVAKIMGGNWPQGVAVGDTRNGDWATSKQEFLGQFNFSLCMENTCYRGYTSEKLWQCIQGKCLPIYFSNDSIYDTFPVDSFLDYRLQNSTAELLDIINEMTVEEYLERMNACIDVYNDAVARKAGVLSRELSWDAFIKRIPLIKAASAAFADDFLQDYSGVDVNSAESAGPLEPTQPQPAKSVTSSITSSSNYLSNSSFRIWSDRQIIEVGAHFHDLPSGWSFYRDGYRSGLFVTRQRGPELGSYALRLHLEAQCETGFAANMSQDLTSRISRKLVGKELIFAFRYRCGPGFSATRGVVGLIMGSKGIDHASRSAPPDRQVNLTTRNEANEWQHASVALKVDSDKTQVHVAVSWAPSAEIGDDNWIEISDCTLTVVQPAAEPVVPRAAVLQKDMVIRPAPIASDIEIAAGAIARTNQTTLLQKLAAGAANHNLAPQDYLTMLAWLPEHYAEMPALKYVTPTLTIPPAMLADFDNYIESEPVERAVGEVGIVNRDHKVLACIVATFLEPAQVVTPRKLSTAWLLALQWLGASQIQPRAVLARGEGAVEFAGGFGIVLRNATLQVVDQEPITLRNEKVSFTPATHVKTDADWFVGIGLYPTQILETLSNSTVRYCIFDAPSFPTGAMRGHEILCWNELLVMTRVK